MYFLVAFTFKMKEINVIHRTSLYKLAKRKYLAKFNIIVDNVPQQMEGRGGHKEIFWTR